MSEWDFLWDLSGQELIDAMGSGGTEADWAYIEEQDKMKRGIIEKQSKKSNGKLYQTANAQHRKKKQNTALFIDGENISYKKAESIIKAVKQQGVLYSSRVYGLQKDEGTKGWSEKANKFGIKDIRLSGGPEKDKADKKIQKDAKREVLQQKNVDIICIATSDKGYVDTVKELRERGKRVVVIGEDKTPAELRSACSKFVKV